MFSIQGLLGEKRSDVNDRDDHNDTPLNVAAYCGKEEVALALITEFGCFSIMHAESDNISLVRGKE